MTCDPYTPTEAEMTEKWSRRNHWWNAKQAMDFKLSDRLRAGVVEDGFIGPELDRWVPVAEGPEARYARVTARKQKEEEAK